jgi:hypothetical protein
MPDRWEPLPRHAVFKTGGLGRRWPRREDGVLENRIGN